MYEGNLARVSNRADWIEVVEITDAETGELIDLTDANLILEVRPQHHTDCSPTLSASTGNGKIVIIDLGQAQFTFDRAEMIGVRPGTYEAGLTISRAGITEQLIIAIVAILDGIVRK